MSVVVEESTTTVLCACGCGEPVDLGYDGQPKTYVDVVHYARSDLNRDRAKQYMQDRHQRRIDAGEMIDIVKFRSAIRALKEKKGWEWQEMADRSGISMNHMRTLMFGKAQKNVSVDFATSMLRSLAGLAVVPTTHTQRKLLEFREARNEITRMYVRHERN